MSRSHLAGDYLVVEWKVNADEGGRVLRYQVILRADGSVDFLYRNLNDDAIDAAADSGCHQMLGLQDGFVSVEDDGKDGQVVTNMLQSETFAVIHKHVYPPVHVDPRQVSGPRGGFGLAYAQTDCSLINGKQGCERVQHCSWCRGASMCLHDMEILRPSNECDKEAEAEKSKTPAGE